MRNHIIFKFLAIFLCAASLLVCIASGAGIFAVAEAGLYNRTVADIRDQQMRANLNGLAGELAARYAALNLSNCPQALIEDYIGSYYQENLLVENQWAYTLKDMNGTLLEDSYRSIFAHAKRYEFAITPEYPVVRSTYGDRNSGFYPEGIFDNTPEETAATDPDSTEPTMWEDSEFLRTRSYAWSDESGDYVYTLGIYRGPTYLVTLYLLHGAYEQEESFAWEVLEQAYRHRYTVILTLFLGLLVFAVTAVYLCCAVGRKPNSNALHIGGLNLLPLDLYAALAGIGIFFLLIAVYNLRSWIATPSLLLPGILWIALCGFGACLLFVGFWLAVAAQSKLHTDYWWRCSLTLISLRLLRKLCRVSLRWLRKASRWLTRQFDRFYSLLPLTWQWLLAGVSLGLLLMIAMMTHNTAFILAVIVLGAAIVLYGVYAYGILTKTVKRMSEGDLHSKVDTQWLLGSFREFGEYLNALASVAELAAKREMKSERMKAELITNVSHDIKTPLTSIINYVDLLQKAKSQESATECLEVLDRQSQRLKKLIDDLIEMSKASTGNMAVSLEAVDAAETVNQALGEFSDKLDALPLTPIFTSPAEPVTMLADGRLTWRVLSNLLSNAVKYALPGTRLYIDLVKLDGNVLISLKNISKEQLNVSSDELMERFVRGDLSRNTEGSGLGLNIAKSLMELQHGQLQLLIDGDLFKATLIFPEA